MTHTPMHWENLASVKEFDQVLDRSRTKPAMVFKHRNSSSESQKVKEALESDWTISPDELDTYLIDAMANKDVADEATKIASASDEFPQIFLFADGATIYDESHDMISAKKIKIALKIINRTFKWLETRV